MNSRSVAKFKTLSPKLKIISVNTNNYNSNNIFNDSFSKSKLIKTKNKLFYDKNNQT